MLSQDRINQADIDALRRGYYEELDVTHRDDQLRFLASSPRQVRWDYSKLRRDTNDFMVSQMVPVERLPMGGNTVTINRWRMRDRDYERVRPPKTLRMVLLGSSNELGHGVNDDETFENLLEDRLNQEDLGGDIGKYEILNFAQSANSLFQQLVRLENEALSFSPDVVFATTYLSEPERLLAHLSKVLRSGCAVPEDFQHAILTVFRQAGVDASMPDSAIQRRFRPYASELIGFAFQRLAVQCQRRGVRACVLYRPELYELPRLHAQRKQELIDLAHQARLPILDLSACLHGVPDKRALMAAPFDFHYNAEGHRLLAEELYRQLHGEGGQSLLRRRAPGGSAGLVSSYVWLSPVPFGLPR
jgi:hypothetical protein